MTTKTKPGLDSSDALRANLLETAVENVQIDPRHEILRKPVKGYSGLIKGLDKLLLELNHPFRNWRLILPEFRSFVLKNNSRYLTNEAGPECARTILQVFLEALNESGKFISAEEVAEAICAYLDKLVSDLTQKQLPAYGESLAEMLSQLNTLSQQNRLIISGSYHPIRTTLKNLINKTKRTELEQSFDWQSLCSFQSSCLHNTYDYWLQQDDPTSFCDIHTDGVEIISHHSIRDNLEQLKQVDNQPASIQQLSQLVEFPSYLEIVKGYRLVATQLGAADSERLYKNYRLLFLFRIMEIDGLSMIHEESLKEINRNLIQLVRKQPYDEIEEFFLRAFVFLRANVKRFPHTALQSIEVLGTEILRCNNGRLVEAFLAQAIRFGFQYSAIQGVTEDWQPIFNTSHLYNIRVWMNLVIQNPEWCSTLLSALIINIKLSGTCIRDTDLFQKEITRLLNSDIGPSYNLVKQFTRLLPVFFNEIGSEGILREVSTELDETHKRKDKLIHFLRKQSHVESSNMIVDFINGIIHFWRTLDKQAIAPYIPEELLHRIDPDSEYVTWVHQVIVELFVNSGFQQEEELLTWSRSEMEKTIMAMTDYPESELRRVILITRMYQLVNLKYDLGFEDIKNRAQELQESGLPDIEPMVQALNTDDPYTGLEAVLDTLEELKDITLSPEKFEAREDIFHKRHIATDIPSVYGRYQEKKFDALSLSFRLENMANVYLEQLTAKAGDTLLTQATFYRVVKALRLFIRALAHLVHKQGVNGLHGTIIGDGKSRQYLENLAKDLEVNGLLSFTGARDRRYILEHLRDFDMLIQPSRYEGFGITVIEGMAAGVPVLVSNIDGPMEIIREGKYGSYFTSGEAIDCAQKILEITWGRMVCTSRLSHRYLKGVKFPFVRSSRCTCTRLSSIPRSISRGSRLMITRCTRWSLTCWLTRSVIMTCIPP